MQWPVCWTVRSSKAVCKNKQKRACAKFEWWMWTAEADAFRDGCNEPHVFKQNWTSFALYMCSVEKRFSKAMGQFYVFDSDHQKIIALIVTNYCTVAKKFNDFLYSLVINLFDLLWKFQLLVLLSIFCWIFKAIYRSDQVEERWIFGMTKSGHSTKPPNNHQAGSPAVSTRNIL